MSLTGVALSVAVVLFARALWRALRRAVVVDEVTCVVIAGDALEQMERGEVEYFLVARRGRRHLLSREQPPPRVIQ